MLWGKMALWDKGLWYMYIAWMSSYKKEIKQMLIVKLYFMYTLFLLKLFNSAFMNTYEVSVYPS